MPSEPNNATAPKFIHPRAAARGKERPKKRTSESPGVEEKEMELLASINNHLLKENEKATEISASDGADVAFGNLVHFNLEQLPSGQNFHARMKSNNVQIYDDCK